MKLVFLNAMAQAYGNDKLSPMSGKRQYRIPDNIPNPKTIIRKWLPEHQQIAGAKLVAPFMNIDKNTSASFNCFVSGVRDFAGQ